MEIFEDEISSLAEEVHDKAYKNYVKAYREALVPIWNLARFANIATVLETIADKKMSETKTIPDLETVTMAMLQKFPNEKLPEPSTCQKIGNVFALLSTACTAYSEAAHG